MGAWQTRACRRISKSAFNRKALAISRAGARINEQRAIFTGIAEHLTPENIDQGNISLARIHQDSDRRDRLAA